MLAKAIEKIVYREPFQPFRPVLDDGEEILVDQPRKASVSGPEMAMVGISRKRGAMGGAMKLRIVPINRVSLVEHVTNGRHGN